MPDPSAVRGPSGNPAPRHSRSALVHTLARELDKPSVYMGGPSQRSLRIAESLADRAVATIAATVREHGEHACGGFEDDAAEFIEQEFGRA